MVSNGRQWQAMAGKVGKVVNGTQRRARAGKGYQWKEIDNNYYNSN
jgi:hypothetical protein